jgi:hypothetical protein
MKYELWQQEEAGEVVGYTFFPVDDIYERRLRLLEAGSKLAWTVEADTYDDAMRLYHAHMGWGPYKPLRYE